MIKKLLAVAVLALSTSVNAAMVNVGGNEYEVSIVTGSFSALSADLTTQVWWGNATLASEFAAALPGGLGTNFFIYGPAFAYGNSGTNVDNMMQFSHFAPWYSDQGTTASEGGLKYATATLVNAAVPIPAAGWLFMSALIGLVGKKRLSR